MPCFIKIPGRQTIKNELFMPYKGELFPDYTIKIATVHKQFTHQATLF